MNYINKRENKKYIYQTIIKPKNIIKRQNKLKALEIQNQNTHAINYEDICKNIANIANTDFDETLIEENYIGKLNLICYHYNAKHFSFELTTDKQFKSCCHKGKVKLIEDANYPNEIKQLVMENSAMSKDFIQNIRSYNNALAFASFGASLQKIVGRGPSVIRICGQIYHNAYALHPDNQQQQRKYGQLYILDNEEANKSRNEYNNKCSLQLLKKLDDILRNINPYAHAYKMMYEVEREEIIRCETMGIEPTNVKMIIKRNENMKDHRYNIARSNEVAVVFVGENGEPPIERDFCIFSKSEGPIHIPLISKHLDPMTYPLMYPAGGFGWMPNMKSGHKSNNVSTLQFYSYKLSIRDDFSPYLNLGKLTQQYVVDAWVKVESSRLYYLRRNQAVLRTEMYTGLMDYLHNKKCENDMTKIGKIVILPSSFIGSPRSLHQNFIDAMILVQTYGKPDLFITMTCNPKWREITENIGKHEEVINRPDIVVRVFHQKLKELKQEILIKKIFGNCIAYTYVIEFQKRGLPHVHMLVFLNKEDKLFNTDKIDEVVSAEIPDSLQYPRLHELVKKFMIHGPCGHQNLHSPCMDIDKGKCTKYFPKEFIENTTYTSGYPKYRRRQDNKIINFPGKKWADNRFVIPYNPYLLLTLNSHINVEVCSTVLCVKYLFKYCYKGHDCAIIEFSNSNKNNEIINESTNTAMETNMMYYDEIKQYEDTRYLSAQEAMYRLNEYEMNELSHAVYRLAVHNENEQYVYFIEGSENEVLNKNNETTLTAWFKLNQEDPNANQYLYTEIPNHYVFDKKEKKWNMRKRVTKPVLVRMYLVNIQQRERFFIRLLLLAVRGAKSFEDLRTYENITYSTFFEAAKARNLISTDEEWDKCLQESLNYMFPKAICELFAYICAFHNPINARELYDKYKDNFYYPSMNETEGERFALNIINKILLLHGYNSTDFNLPNIENFDDALGEYQINNEEIDCVIDDLDNRINSLTEAQRIIFNAAINATKGCVTDKCIFVDGPGGTGKSYLLNLLICYFNKHKISVLAVAWTGIAANLLKGGKTVHTFKLPLNINEISSCNIKCNTPHGDAIKNVQVIIWDEISMASKHAFEAVERSCRDLCNNNDIFGGKVVIVSGNFRQTLPIVRFGNRVQIIENCVKVSQLWQNFQCMSLKQNKRVSEEEREFKNWLLNIGNGYFSTEYEKHNELIKIPKEILSNGKIIENIFGNSIDINDNDFYESVILAPRNIDVIEINNEILDKINGPSKEYLSIDSIENENDSNLSEIIPIEFLNSITPNGLPLHKLKIKIGSIIMLLRNINLNNGLCNGTRLIVEELREFTILGKILTGNKSGSYVIIPRMNLSPSLEEIPFHMIRRQFPIRLAHAMTINKSQGQSFKKVGIYLPTPVFSHGQLYVAFSRVMSQKNLKILIPTNTIRNKKEKEKDNEIYTRNIVYTEIL